MAGRPGRVTFLLFIASEPFEDAIPSGRISYVSSASAGSGPLGTKSWGGREPADRPPGQTYGEQARTARMVVEIAGEHGLAVKVVDVEAPGDDEPLARQYISPDDDLPILVRPDGRRLSGDEAFVPKTVERFLLGG